MTHSTPDALRALFPNLQNDDLAAAQECVRRYVSLAVEVRRTHLPASLTQSEPRGSVIPGPVEPRTFTNTG